MSAITKVTVSAVFEPDVFVSFCVGLHVWSMMMVTMMTMLPTKLAIGFQQLVAAE